MNNQEAIKILGQYDVSNIHFYTTDGEEIPFTEWSDAIDMAISALQEQDLQPTCNQLATDYISKQSVIDAITDENIIRNMDSAMDSEMHRVKRSVHRIIASTPSAQPEPYEDAVPRTSIEYICRKNTVSTNPYEHKYHDKFIQFMDDPEISDFGRWQHSNGFNTALVAVKCDLDKVPSAQPEITEDDVKEYCRKRCLIVVTSDFYDEMTRRWASAQPERKTGK